MYTAGQTVLLFLARICERDVKPAFELLAEDVVFENPAMDPPADRVVGHDGVRQMYEALAQKTTAMAWPVLRMVEQGDLVMVERVDKFWFPEGLFPKGNLLTARVCSVWEVGQGKIKLWRDYYDRGDVRRCLGVDMAELSRVCGYDYARTSDA